jgi:hypothetical protein
MITIYKANKAVRGALLSINFIAKADKFTNGQKERGEKSFYWNLVSQTGWDSVNQNGVFKGGKKLTVKFAQHEMAGVIAAIEKNVSLAQVMNIAYVFHDQKDFGVSITFEPNFKKNKVGDKWETTNEQNGFVFRVTKTSKVNKEEKESISIGINFAELELIKLYIEDGLSHIFTALFNEDVNRGKIIRKNVADSISEASDQATNGPENDSDSEEF